MPEPFSHTFFDVEIETVNASPEIHLIKLLSVSGHRFTYELRGPLTDDAITYMKGLMDTAVFSDLIIERSGEGWEGRETRTYLKKHS
jgi:dsDNA-specific endonuclease/ATPase MutS2